ncbi:hypothetical protein D5396_16335 [Rahnella inusitata]|uniref:Uncharacterized protein n=1 Tax=Rahnella inusitata TaxID=58169 RepID=A0ABX9NX62_9GAMM|nr:hypothetical protein D5396_16335 [Rahnella inusitata]
MITCYIVILLKKMIITIKRKKGYKYITLHIEFLLYIISILPSARIHSRHIYECRQSLIVRVSNPQVINYIHIY